MLLQSWNYAIQTGELALTHRQSCLALLPKKGKDLALLGNWRPISLSACDLKIITKAYANRLKTVLPSILCESQAAYVPGRDISFNNRILNLAKKYARKHNEDLCVVSLDAKKAFDSVSHGYLVKVLQAYDFPDEFIHVFRTLYSKLETVVQVNGHLSTPFPIKNGVKQGDALSCGLFVLAMDPLIRNIVNNDSIEGLLLPIDHMEVEEIKVLAYADDVTIVCRNGDLQPIFDEYERLTAVSGLTLNADKTEIFNLIESRNNSNRINYMGSNFLLGRVEAMTICGMCLASDGEVEYQQNVLKRISIMEEKIVGWGKRHITMNGRMMLAKTFLHSQIVFPAQFTQIGAKEIKKIERLIYAFVNGARNLYGPEHIARKYLKAQKCEERINGVDVHSFINAIALRQFGKASQSSRILGAVQASVAAPKDFICDNALSLLKIGATTFLRHNPMPNIAELEAISGLHISIFFKFDSDAARSASRLGIGNLFLIQSELYNGRIPRPRINNLIRKLPLQLARLIRAGVLLNAEPSFALMSNKESIQLNSTKSIKQALQSWKPPTQALDLNKVHRRQDLPAPDNPAFTELFNNLWKIKQPQLRAIRLKLLYKEIYSNERRHRFGLSDSPHCVGCGLIETVEHQLLECDNARRVWRMFHEVSGVEILSFKDIIECSADSALETLKSTIIKALIQITRNHNVPEKVIAHGCAYFLRIEAISNRTYERTLLSLVDKLNRIP